MYFDYPLEQGLRLTLASTESLAKKYFDYPLEQGLRLHTISVAIDSCSILIIH